VPAPVEADDALLSAASSSSCDTQYPPLSAFGVAATAMGAATAVADKVLELNVRRGMSDVEWEGLRAAEGAEAGALSLSKSLSASPSSYIPASMWASRNMHPSE
jgi:hypothetical protein